ACGNETNQYMTAAPIKELKLEQKAYETDDTTIENFPFEEFTEKPVQWGENVDGVKTHFQTDEKEMALTFDACGGDFGNRFDESLITFLKKEKIPATLFMNERWINKNEETFLELVDDDLFQIENHGTEHQPLSVSGGEAWGISATESPQAVYNEIDRKSVV